MVNLNNIPTGLMPPNLVGPIFDKALESSAVMALCRKVPLAVNAQTNIQVSLGVPTAGWVAEGASKPVSAGGVGMKTMVGKKVAVLVPLSEEVVNTNPAGIYTQLQQELPVAIGRAFDYAAIHGKDLASGGAGPFANYIRQYASTTELGTAAASAGGMWKDIWSGVKTVTDNGYDFTGFAADPRLRPTIATSVDANGRPFFVDNMGSANTRDNAGSLVGYPTYFNRGVSGTYRRQNDKVWDITINGTPTGGTWSVTIAGTQITGLAYNISAANLQTALRAALPAGNFSTVAVSGTTPYSITFPIGVGKPVVDQTSLTGGTAAASTATVARHTNPDTTVRAIGGDWTQCAYGVGMDINIRVSTQASYTPDGGTTWLSAFQNNLVLLLAEAYYGFVVSDNEGAFNAYLDAS